MSRVLYFDCFSGASGDMILGALIDAGVSLDSLRVVVGSLADISASKVLRSGISATKFSVQPLHRTPSDAHPAHHEHDHPHHHQDDHQHGGGHTHGNGHDHRSLDDIGRLIDRSALSSEGKHRARELFLRLGEAEAAIHQVPLDRIHLHEVGALDSIIDIVGTVHALESLGVHDIVASPLNVGGGTVECEHGTFPVPAPATVKLLQGVPIYSNGTQAELVTPTGALLVTGYAREYGAIPPMRIERIGYGAGSRDLPGTPNVLRVMIGERDADPSIERILVMECEIDDMNPQIYGVLMDRLYGAGAFEVFYAPIQMKKNRPGVLVTVLAPTKFRESLSAMLFEETTTLGVRYHEMDRVRLERELVTIETPLGPIRFKVATRNGSILNAAPEFDDCARLSAEHKIAVKQVHAIATKAYLDQATGGARL